MARLANISGKDAVKALERAAWRVAGQVGSHVVMTKAGSPSCCRYFVEPIEQQNREPCPPTSNEIGWPLETYLACVSLERFHGVGLAMVIPEVERKGEQEGIPRLERFGKTKKHFS